MQNGNIILIASTLEGLQCLQYNGWRFEKCEINSTTAFNEINVNAMHFEKFQNKNILGK